MLIQGKHVLPQAKEAMKLLTNNKKLIYPTLFVTNSSGRDSVKAQQLSMALNIDVGRQKLVSSGISRSIRSFNMSFFKKMFLKILFLASPIIL